MSGGGALPGIDGAGIVVTGAAGGIGEGVARRLAGHGARLALIDLRADALGAVADEVGAAAFAADLADEGSTEAAMDAAIGHLGDVGGLVNVAGIQRLGPLAEQGAADFDAHYLVNLRGTWLVTRAAARAMAPWKAFLTCTPAHSVVKPSARPRGVTSRISSCLP